MGEVSQSQQNIDFLHLPEEQNFDKTAWNLLKVVRKLISESFDQVQLEFERMINEANAVILVKLEDRVQEVDGHVNYVQKRLDPLLQLMNVSVPGKSLPDSIVQYVSEQSVLPQVNIIKEQLLPHYVTQDENRLINENAEKRFTADLSYVRQECLKEVENLRKRCLLSDNFDRFKYESEIMFNELKRKEANLRHMHDQLQEQTNNLAELNSRKADSERLWELKESLSNYVSLDIFGQAERNILKRATIVQMEEVKQDLKDKYLSLKTIIDTHATRTEAREWIEDLSKQIYQDLLFYHRIDEFKEFKGQYEIFVRAIDGKFEDVFSKFTVNDQERQLMKENIDKRALQADLNELKEESRLFAYRYEVRQLKQWLQPIIEQIKEDMEDFKIERQQHTQILIRYDEIITDKASKHIVEEVKLDLQRNYAKQLHTQQLEDQLEQQRAQTKMMHRETMNKFEEINQVMSVEIYSAVKKAIKQMTQIVTKAQEDTESKNMGMNKELLSQISAKAAKSDLEQIEMQKSNKVDTEQLLDSLSTVHRQLKQALVLIMESIKYEITNVSESQMAKEHKKQYILTQFQFLAKWVISFDPLDQNHTNQGEGSDYLKQIEGRLLQDYTDALMKETSSLSHQNLSSVPKSFQNLRFSKSRHSNQRNQNHSQTYQMSKNGQPEIIHQDNSIGIMKSALAKLGGSAPFGKQSPAHSPSQLSFISHHQQETENCKAHNYSTIEKSQLPSSLKTLNVTQPRQNVPKLETAPTSPAHLRETLQRTMDRRFVRESPKLIASARNNDDIAVVNTRDKKTIDILPPLLK